MASRPKHAEPRPSPRLYLVTPRLDDAAAFVAPLSRALAVADVAAVLLRLTEGDEQTQISRIKTLSGPVQDAGAALLTDGHAGLVARGGADGAHLGGIDAFSAAVQTLKPDGIAGCGGLETRHDAMLAAEQGADYVMFGEPDTHGRRPAFAAIEERVGWWAEVFEAPCVAYAGALDELAPLIKAGADFIALGDFIWRDLSAVDAVLAEAVARMQLPEPAV